MTALKLRRAIVYAATGMFFAVAALAQSQGAPVTDVLLKAGVSCGVLVALGVALVHIVEDGPRRDLAPTTRIPAQPLPPGATSAEQPPARDVQ